MNKKPGRPKVNPRDRFMKYIDHEPTPEGCILWTGAKNTAGYGVLNIDGKLHYSHRLALQFLADPPIPIPKDKHLQHTCFNRNCVNPEHLMINTHEYNMDTKQTERLIRLLRSLGYHVIPPSTDNPRKDKTPRKYPR